MIRHVKSGVWVCARCDLLPTPTAPPGDHTLEDDVPKVCATCKGGGSVLPQGATIIRPCPSCTTQP